MLKKSIVHEVVASQQGDVEESLPAAGWAGWGGRNIHFVAKVLTFLTLPAEEEQPSGFFNSIGRKQMGWMAPAPGI